MDQRAFPESHQARHGKGIITKAVIPVLLPPRDAPRACGAFIERRRSGSAAIHAKATICPIIVARDQPEFCSLSDFPSAIAILSR